MCRRNMDIFLSHNTKLPLNLQKISYVPVWDGSNWFHIITRHFLVKTVHLIYLNSWPLWSSSPTASALTPNKDQNMDIFLGPGTKLSLNPQNTNYVPVWYALNQFHIIMRQFLIKIIYLTSLNLWLSVAKLFHNIDPDTRQVPFYTATFAMKIPSLSHMCPLIFQSVGGYIRLWHLSHSFLSEPFTSLVTLLIILHPPPLGGPKKRSWEPRQCFCLP